MSIARDGIWLNSVLTRYVRERAGEWLMRQRAEEYNVGMAVVVNFAAEAAAPEDCSV